MPQILYVGTNADDRVLRSILQDMTEDAYRQLQETGIQDESHPAYPAYLSLQDALQKWDAFRTEEDAENGGTE